MSEQRTAAEQLPLFLDPGPERTTEGRVRPAPVAAGIAELARELPSEVYLGGSTWSFPGWAGLVYDRPHPSALLAREGLAVYARHPLLRAVGIDRTYYAPITAEAYAAYAEAVPEGFRFLVKAHEDVTLCHFPDRPRYGERRGRANRRYLDAAYASAEVVAPFAEGLGEKAGALVFQFAPQDLGSAGSFAAALYGFLSALPRGPTYGVEIRNRSLLGQPYAEALRAAGACHCLNIHPTMPDLPTQARLAWIDRAPALVLRWIVRPGLSYEAAKGRYRPFDRLVDEDPRTRAAVALFALEAAGRGVPALITVNNLAEGCAPRSIARLAREIAAGRPSDEGPTPDPAVRT